MTSRNFDAAKNLSWYCHSCALPNSSNLFDTFNCTPNSPGSSNDPSFPLLSSPGAPVHQSSPIAPQIRPKKSVKRLKFQMINFDSLYPKRDELSTTLLDENLDFVLGCETHLDSNISDPEFLPPNYLASPARSDRNRLGGGIIVIHKSDLSVNVVRKAKDAEFLAIKVQCEGKHPLILSIAYRRPNNDLAYMDTLCSHIRETVTTFPNCAHWFCGDYNLPDINWSDESIVGNQYSKQIS